MIGSLAAFFDSLPNRTLQNRHSHVRFLGSLAECRTALAAGVTEAVAFTRSYVVLKQYLKNANQKVEGSIDRMYQVRRQRHDCEAQQNTDCSS